MKLNYQFKMSQQSVINAYGGLNTCYIFYLRMADCVRKETFFDLMCKENYEDWQECRLRKRYVKNYI